MLFTEFKMEDALEVRYEEGMADGIRQREEQSAMLTEKLVQEKRTDDLLKAAGDKEFRNKLYSEYGIEEKGQ